MCLRIKVKNKEINLLAKLMSPPIYFTTLPHLPFWTLEVVVVPSLNITAPVGGRHLLRRAGLIEIRNISYCESIVAFYLHKMLLLRRKAAPFRAREDLDK